VSEQPAELVGQSDIDPDLDRAGTDVFDTARRSRPAVPWAVLGVVCVGGVAGSLARYGLGQAFPHPPHEFPWTTFGINISGCLFIGVLMVLLDQVWPTKRLLRPLLGTGLLGGYTTFSTYIVDIQHLLTADAARPALAYLAGTLLAALVAVYAGTTVTRLALDRLRRHERT